MGAKPRYDWVFWRRVRDSNPRDLSVYSISSAAPSTTRTTLRVSQCISCFGKKQDNTQERYEVVKIRSRRISCAVGKVRGRSDLWDRIFRVRPVMTTSIHLRIDLPDGRPFPASPFKIHDFIWFVKKNESDIRVRL